MKAHCLFPPMATLHVLNSMFNPTEQSIPKTRSHKNNSNTNRNTKVIHSKHMDLNKS